MISDPIYNSFKLFIPPNWFYPEVVDAVWPALKQMDLPFASVEAYMNSTVINGVIPGLKDNGSGEQVYNGERKKTFKGSLAPKENVTKTFPVSFKLRNNFLNWIIMYKQFLAFTDHANEDSYLQPLYLHILNDYGNAIISLIYKDIRIQEVPPLDFTKQDRGILTKEFQITFAFNDFNLSFDFDKLSNNTKPEYQY